MFLKHKLYYWECRQKKQSIKFNLPTDFIHQKKKWNLQHNKAFDLIQILHGNYLRNFIRHSTGHSNYWRDAAEHKQRACTTVQLLLLVPLGQAWSLSQPSNNECITPQFLGILFYTTLITTSTIQFFWLSIYIPLNGRQFLIRNPQTGYYKDNPTTCVHPLLSLHFFYHLALTFKQKSTAKKNTYLNTYLNRRKLLMATLFFFLRMHQFLLFHHVQGFFYIQKSPQMPFQASQEHSTQSHKGQVYHAHRCTAHCMLFHWNIILT